MNQIGVFIHCPGLHGGLEPVLDVLSVLIDSQRRHPYVLQFTLDFGPII
jgi:hypothetical protein